MNTSTTNADPPKLLKVRCEISVASMEHFAVHYVGYEKSSWLEDFLTDLTHVFGNDKMVTMIEQAKSICSLEEMDDKKTEISQCAADVPAVPV